MKKVFSWVCLALRVIGWGLVAAFLSVVLLIIIGLVSMLFSDGSGRCDELFECKDVYEFFGDGRFYIMTIMDHKSLFDEEFNGGMGILVDLDRYFVHDDYVYLEGYYSYTFNSAAYYDLESGEMIAYESLDEVPRYTVLNYETGEAEFHLTLDDIPEEDREFFTKDLGWWCKLKHTCYEKE